MAQKVNIILVDDLDGSEAEETVEFGLDGSKYEIDLSTAHAKELREALTKYIDAGRRTQAKRGRPKAAAAPSTPRSGGRKRVASMEEVEAAKTK